MLNTHVMLMEPPGSDSRPRHNFWNTRGFWCLISIILEVCSMHKHNWPSGTTQTLRTHKVRIWPQWPVLSDVKNVIHCWKNRLWIYKWGEEKTATAIYLLCINGGEGPVPVGKALLSLSLSCLYYKFISQLHQEVTVSNGIIVLIVWWPSGSGYPMHQWDVRENNMGGAHAERSPVFGGLGTH